MPLGIVDLFRGWQLAAIPNYASRALIQWAADGTATTGAVLSFARPCAASHLAMHAAGRRFLTLRLAADPSPQAISASGEAGSEGGVAVALDVRGALSSVVCGR